MMSNSRYRGRKFGSRGAGVPNGNGFDRSRFIHPNFVYQGASPRRMSAPEKWVEYGSYQSWQRNTNFHPNPLYRGNNLQFRANIRNRTMISHGVVRQSGPGRPAAPQFPMGFIRHLAPREFLPAEEEAEDKHQIPLPGSEEERQRKISETADKLKQKLSTSATEEDLTHFLEDELFYVPSSTPEEGETLNKGIPELMYEPPELDLSFNDLRDIGRVDSNNSRLENVDDKSNDSISVTDQEPTVKSTNNVVTIKDKEETEPTCNANDKNRELPEPICGAENIQLQDNIEKKLTSSDLNKADGKSPVVDSTVINFISKRSLTDVPDEQSSAFDLIGTSGSETIQKSNEDASRNIADINANIQFVRDAEIQSNRTTDSATPVYTTSYNEIYDNPGGNKNKHIHNSKPIRTDTRAHGSRNHFKKNKEHAFFHGTQKFNRPSSLMHVQLPSYSYNVPDTSHNTQPQASVPFSPNSYPPTFEPRSNTGSEISTSQGSLHGAQSPLDCKIQNVPLSEQVLEFNPNKPPPVIHKREETFQSSPFLDRRFSPQERSYASPLNRFDNSPVANFNVSPNYAQLPAVNVSPYQPFVPNVQMNFPSVLLPPQPAKVPLLLGSIANPSPPPPKTPIENNSNNHRNMDEGMQAGMKLARQIMDMTDDANNKNMSPFPKVSSNIPAPDKTVRHSPAKGRDTNIASKDNKKKLKKDSRDVVHSPYFKDDGATMKNHEDAISKEHRPKVFDSNSTLCRLQRTEERLRTPVSFPEIHQSASSPNNHRIHIKESQSRKNVDSALSNEKSNTSSDRTSDKRDSEKSQRVSSTENNQKSKKEPVKDKAPTSETSWRAKAISRYLKMSINDIRNMVNNASRRKFDEIAMKHLVKERKPSLSLEMRNTEDEKMKEYGRDEFMNQLNQLNAVLDSGDTVDVGDLPTEFIHHLSEVLQLDSLQLDVESSEKQTSEVHPLPENLIKTATEDRCSPSNKVESKQQQEEPKVDELEFNEKAKKIPRASTFDSGERLNEMRTSPSLAQPGTLTFPRINNPTDDVDEIYLARIAKAKKLADTNSDRSRVRKCCSEDRNPFRPEKYEAWSRKKREDFDAYRNLTKEEWEAKYKSKSSATDSSSVRSTNHTRDESLKYKGNRHCMSESPLRSSSASPITRVSKTATRPTEPVTVESCDDSNSSSSSSSSNSSSDTFSTSSSTSRSDERAVSPSVTKLLKVIKEKEKIAKKKSINETIRDEVAAEIEEQRKKKNKEKSQKLENWRRKQGKKRRKAEKRKRIGYSDLSESNKKSKEFQLLDDKGKKETKKGDKISSSKSTSVVPVSIKPQIEKQQVSKVARETATLEKCQSDQTKAQLKPVPKLIEVDHSMLAQKSVQIARDSTTDSNNGKVKSIPIIDEVKEVATNKEQVVAPASVSLEQVSSTAATGTCSTEKKSYKKIDINAYKERKRLKNQIQLKESPKNSTNQDTTRALSTNKLDLGKLNTTNETTKLETDKVQKDHPLNADQNKEVSKRTNLKEEEKPVARKDKESSLPLEPSSGHKNSAASVDFDTSAKSKECRNEKKLSHEAETMKSSEQKKSKPVFQKESNKSISLFDCSKPVRIRSEGKKELKLKENMKNKKISKLAEVKPLEKHKKTSASKQEISSKKIAANSSKSELEIENKTVREGVNSVIRQNQEPADGNQRSTNINKTIEKSILSSQQVVDQTESSINSKDENGNKKTESKVPSKELHLRINVDIEKSGPSINIKSLTNNSILATESKVPDTNDVKQNDKSESLVSSNFNIQAKIIKSSLSPPDSPSCPCIGFPASENDVNNADHKDPIKNEGSPFGDAVAQQDVANVNDRSTGVSEIKKDATEKRNKTSSEGNQPAGDAPEEGNEPFNVSHEYYRIVDKKSTKVKLDDVDVEDCVAKDTDFFVDKSSDKVNGGVVTSTSSINFKQVFDRDKSDKKDLKENSTLPNKETTVKDSQQNSEFGVRPKIGTKDAAIPIATSITKVDMEFTKLKNGLQLIPTSHGKDAPDGSNKKDETTSKSEPKKDKLHKVRHKSKLKHKKEKLKPPKEMIEEAVKSDTVEVVKYPNTQEGIMARMIAIDIEIHKLMTEKMTLYQMLSEDQVLLSNNNNLKESVVMEQERKSDTPRPRTPIQWMSLLTQEKAKTNETFVESSSVIETSINLEDPSKSKPDNEKGCISNCTIDDGEKKPSRKNKKHKVRKFVPSSFPRIVLGEKKRTGVNEAGETEAFTDLDTELVNDSSQVSGSGTNFHFVIDKISTQTDNKDALSDDKPEAAKNVQPVVEKIAEEKLIDNCAIKDNEERAASLKTTDRDCSKIRQSIYSDDSTLDFPPQRTGGTKEPKKSNVGLALLEETYKKEIARTRKRATARRRRRESHSKLSTTALTVEEEDLPLSVLYIKKKQNPKQKLTDFVVNQTNDDVLKNMDDVINAVVENRTEELYTASIEGTASSVSERNIEFKQNEQISKDNEEPYGESPTKIASSNARELLSNKHLQRDTKASRSSEASDTNVAKIDETTELAENIESRLTKIDDKNIQSTASKNAEVGEGNRQLDEEATNDIGKLSVALNDNQNTIILSETEGDSKLTRERKSNEKDNINSVILQSNCKPKNDHFISLRNYKESHKAREIVKALSEEDGSHDYSSALPVIENTETSKNDEELGKKSTKRKRENTKDIVRRKSKYGEPVKKRTKSETSANTELEIHYKCFRAQNISPALSPCEERRIQKKERSTASETDAFFSDSECSKAIRKQKLRTVSEMMNCVVKVVDCKRAASNMSVNSNSQSQQSSKVNTQPQYHPVQLDSLISSQKESPQCQASKTIKRSDDQTNFARVKRPKSDKIDLNDEERIAGPDIEVMPALSKEEVKKHESSDVLVGEEKIITTNQQPSENPPPTLTVIDTKDEEELPRTQYTVHNGPILDIKVFGDSFLAASEDGRIYRYNQSSNGILNIYKGHVAAVTCLHMCNASYTDISKEWIFSGSLDGTLRCYNVMTGVQVRDPANVGSPIQCMDEAWGIIFVGTKSGHVSRYHIKSGAIKEDSIQFSDKSVLALKATNEGPRRVLIVASRSQPITIRDAQSGLFLRAICGQRSYTVYSLMRDHNLIYCGTSSTSIPVFDFTNGEQTMQYDAGVGIVCMRLYGSLLFAGCYDGNIYVFDTKEHRLVCSIPGPGNMLLSMEVVDNKIIAGSKDKRLQSWQMPQQVRSCL